MNPRPDLAELHALVQKWRKSGNPHFALQCDREATEPISRILRDCAEELAAALRKIEQDSAAAGAQGESISERMVDGENAQADLEEALDTVGVEHERISFDPYDNSLELYGVKPDYRLNEAAQRVCFGAGFTKVYVNHTDKWETHYTWGKEFNILDGWRVSYPHKRQDNDPAILLEKHTESWPKEWYESGKAKVIEAALSASTGEQRDGK